MSTQTQEPPSSEVTTNDIFSAMEELRDEYPHEPRIDIWVSNRNGVFQFTVYIPESERLGLPSVFADGTTPSEAVESMLRQCPPFGRTPGANKARRIAELKRELEKLEAA